MYQREEKLDPQIAKAKKQSKQQARQQEFDNPWVIIDQKFEGSTICESK